MKVSLGLSLFNSRFCALFCLQACALGGGAWAQAPTPSGSPTYTVTDICTPVGNPTAADINDKGQVVGVATAADGSGHPFLWQNGQTTELPAGITPVRINNNGQVLAQRYVNGAVTRSFVWQNGKLTDLGSLGGSYVYGMDINDKGQVIGYSALTGDHQQHSFLWQNGTMTDLGTLGSVVQLSYGSRINNQGDIVAGIISDGDRQNAVLVQGGNMGI